MKSKLFRYKTTLFPLERGMGGIYAGFPFDVRGEFGTGGSVRVHCWIDSIPKNGSLVPLGNGEHGIHVRKEIRTAIGKEEGDEVEMVVEQDLSERTIAIPDDFQWLMDEDPHLKEQFDKLSFTNQRVIINHINVAKRLETRVSRIENMIKRILVGFYSG